MTIQNIQDVMDRIISLNRNLTEETLRNLLSASGWDKEDVMEGLKIFKMTNKNIILEHPNNAVIESNPLNKTPEIQKENPIQQDFLQESKKNNLEEEKKEKERIQKENEILAKIKKDEEEKENARKDDILAKLNNLDNENKKDFKIENPILNNNLDFKNKDEVENDFNKNLNLNPNLDKNSTNSKSPIGKIIFVFVLIILLFGVVYFLYSNKYLDKYLNKNKISLNQTNLENQNPNQISNPENSNNDFQNQINNQNPNQVNNLNQTDVQIQNQEVLNQIEKDKNFTSSSSSLENQNNGDNLLKNLKDTNLETLTRELNSLKNEFESYKNKIQTNSENKTIVKYISSPQTSISSISASTSGFAIKYTNGKKGFIPFATTSAIDVLSTKVICFKDATSTNRNINLKDLCIEKQSLQDLILNSYK